jgi:Uma2 family endonuclease
MTINDYLKLEESSQVRHEYVRGQIFAMTGSTLAHNVICCNLCALLRPLVQGTGCHVFQTDVKVRVERAESFYYPDISLTCEPVKLKDVWISAPSLIIEVLSPSTKQIDQREKLVSYRQLPSLRYYILVHQNKMLVEVYESPSHDRWKHTLLSGGDELLLDVLADRNFKVAVTEVYAGLDLPLRVKESEEEYDV